MEVHKIMHASVYQLCGLFNSAQDSTRFGILQENHKILQLPVRSEGCCPGPKVLITWEWGQWDPRGKSLTQWPQRDLL